MTDDSMFIMPEKIREIERSTSIPMADIKVGGWYLLPEMDNLCHTMGALAVMEKDRHGYFNQENIARLKSALKGSEEEFSQKTKALGGYFHNHLAGVKPIPKEELRLILSFGLFVLSPEFKQPDKEYGSMKRDKEELVREFCKMTGMEAPFSDDELLARLGSLKILGEKYANRRNAQSH